MPSPCALTREPPSSIRSTPASVAELVRTGRVRELRGIGSGIAGKLEELVETGDIAELSALEARIPLELVGYGRMLGLTAQRVLGIAEALGIRTAAEFKDAVASGRLRDVPGIGPTTESRIRAALEREPQAPRGLTLEPQPGAGSRRWRTSSAARWPARRGASASCRYELAVVCASDDPRAVIAAVRVAAADRRACSSEASVEPSP